jgi:hypothetical protein
MDTTNISSMPTKTQTVIQCCYVLPLTYYYRMESTDYTSQEYIILFKNGTQVSCLLAQDQLGSGHSIGNYIVQQMDLVK